MFAPSFRKHKGQSTTTSTGGSFSWRRRPEETKAQQFTQLQIEYPKTLMAHGQKPKLVDDRPEELIEAGHEILSTFTNWTKTLPLAELLDKFNCFFINHDPVEVPTTLNKPVYQLLTYDCPTEFMYLINRCAFGFINTCLRQKKTRYIQQLISLFQDRPTYVREASFAAQKFRDWVDSYMTSHEYHVLELFSPTIQPEQKTWCDRYLKITLLAETFDPETAIEQRQACQFLYQFLKNRYKFQLVMYLTKTNQSKPKKETVFNPTLINPSTLRLIHKIVIKRHRGYPQMAEAFMAQHEQDSYLEFKRALVSHLLDSVGGDRRLKWLPRKLEQHLETLDPDKNDVMLGHHLIAKTCNEIIGYLLNPESFADPTHPFTLLMIQREFLSLSIILLKLVLISPRSYGSLIIALDNLMQEYSQKPKAECEWLTGLLETVQVILTLAVNEGQYYSFATAA